MQSGAAPTGEIERTQQVNNTMVGEFVLIWETKVKSPLNYIPSSASWVSTVSPDCWLCCRALDATSINRIGFIWGHALFLTKVFHWKVSGLLFLLGKERHVPDVFLLNWLFKHKYLWLSCLPSTVVARGIKSDVLILAYPIFASFREICEYRLVKHNKTWGFHSQGDNFPWTYCEVCGNLMDLFKIHNMSTKINESY